MAAHLPNLKYVKGTSSAKSQIFWTPSSETESLPNKCKQLIEKGVID